MGARSPAPPDDQLPANVPALHALLRAVLAVVRDLGRENAALRAENEVLEAGGTALRAKLDAALRHRFGRRSERARVAGRRPDPSAGPDPGPAAGRGRGRTDAEKVRPCRGYVRACIGEPAAEQLDYDPGAFFVRRAVKET